jgi:hypothetical protein
VSISSIQSNPLANIWSGPSKSTAGTSDTTQGSFGLASASDPSVSQGASQTNGAAPSFANPLQSLGIDIQAFLAGRQIGSTASGASTAATNSAAGGATTAASPEQMLLTDLQTLLNNLSSSAPASGQTTASSNTQTANASSTDPASQTEHHHHHHHGGGEDASGASAVADAASSSGSPTGTDQPATQVFAAGYAMALQAYGGPGTSAASSSLTA